MARPAAGPSVAGVGPATGGGGGMKRRSILKTHNWSYKTILLLFMIGMGIVAQIVALSTPGWIFFQYMNRRSFYGIFLMMVCDEFISQWMWEHWWEYTTTIQSTTCKNKFFPSLGIRDSYMLISESVESEQFSYLDNNSWLIASAVMTSFTFFAYIVAFIMVIVGINKPKLIFCVDATVYASLALGAMSTVSAGGIYMYKMLERCTFSSGAHCWIGYSFGFACAAVAFALGGIAIRLCERKGLCINGNGEAVGFGRMGFWTGLPPERPPGDVAAMTSTMLNRKPPPQGSPPPNYPSNASSYKTVCTAI